MPTLVLCVQPRKHWSDRRQLVASSVRYRPRVDSESTELLHRVTLLKALRRRSGFQRYQLAQTLIDLLKDFKDSRVIHFAPLVRSWFLDLALLSQISERHSDGVRCGRECDRDVTACEACIG